MRPVAVVVGNPKPASRTLAAAVAAADVLAKATGAPAGHLIVDLAGHAARLFDQADPGLSRLTAEVADADLAVFASPTHKASYTGMLKAFLDRYGTNGLAGAVAVPLMTGGWAGHLLAVEVHLRPVLVELGAVVPARGLYVTEPEFDDVGAAVDHWAGTAAPLIRAALGRQRQEP
jgi:FMN reductase